MKSQNGIREKIYLDYNATTPVAPVVAERMIPWLTERFGNPSSGHVFGKEAREAVENARAEVAGLIGASPDEIFFTSGGTESDNLAVMGVAGRYPSGHIVVSSIEHPAILAPARYLEDRGFSITRLPVDRFGRVDAEELETCLREDTVLVSIMHSNNEIGTLQPIREAAEKVRARGIPFHTDAAQSPGKVSLDVEELGVDLMTIAGHKLYAPKGIGALYVRRGVHVAPLLRGGGQEKKIRPGTENVPYIVGLGAAAVLAGDPGWGQRMSVLADFFLSRMEKDFPGVRLNGHPVERLPNTLNLFIPGIDAYSLLEKISDRLAASAGAACHGGSKNPSAVLTAIGLSDEEALSSIRFSLGRETTETEIGGAIGIILGALRGTLRQ